MQDSEQEYPLKQHSTPQHGHHSFDDFNKEEDGERQDERETPTSPQLPRGRVRKALIIALIAGVLAALENIIVTLINSSLYRQAAGYAPNPSKLPIGVATTVLGLFCLTSFISLIIYFVAGFVTGKVAVERRMGFLGGFVAGIVAYLLGYVAQQFPGYPATASSNLNGGFIGIGSGIIAGLVIAALLALISALVGFLGAWAATRHHAYYYAGEEE